LRRNRVPLQELSGQFAPSLEDIERIARETFDNLSGEFRGLCGDIVFFVADFPEADVLKDLRAESEFDLLGLFQGTGLAHDEATPATGRMPNAIYLYRRPILDYWAENHESLGAIVGHVLIHEIGHHFGLSDADMAKLEREA
jgi:predicted Zn-dependent protease with MMP-like domain